MSYVKVHTFAPQPATTRSRSVHLGEDPKGENFLYTNGRSVIIRSIKNPFVAAEYTQHAASATVAKYSPSGFYIASGDERGNVRVWDTINAENILKTETRALAGRINDLAWDFESKRIVAAGEGKDKHAHAFLFDSASSVGEISGHSKPVNSVALRPGRPFKAVTGSDDTNVNFYPGVPFKFEKSINNHSRFVQSVRYSPTGDFFASAGMDAKIFLFDGKTGDLVGEFSSDNGHTGGILSISWNKEGTQLLSVSSDTTAKIWDVATRAVIHTVQIGDAGLVDNQQVGCLWQGEHLITVSLNGDINYISKDSATPIRVVKGHQKAITALAAIPGSRTFYTGSYDGRVHAWSLGPNGSDPTHFEVSGAGHSNQIKGLAADGSGRVVSVGMDDTVRSIEDSVKAFSVNAAGTNGVPVGVATQNGVVVVATSTGQITVSKDGSQIASLSVDWVPSAVALSPNGATIAIGDEEKRVRIFNSNLELVQEVDKNRSAITALSFSPDGNLLASADKERSIIVYSTADWTVRTSQWMFHTARVNSIAWSPDSLHAVSGSLDTNVEIWSVEKPTKHISIKGAHLEGVNATAFLDNETVISAGQDGSIKIWKVTHH
ncbi:WD40-repeat-containing domain protein [Chytriomyces sp. MP71]|nr:WD40-repeat-containing domain protein [Chytriomyces sp. MP71]